MFRKTIIINKKQLKSYKKRKKTRKAIKTKSKTITRTKYVKKEKTQSIKQPINPIISPPSVLQIEVTKNCNLKCIMCHKGQNTKFDRSDISGIVLEQIKPAYPTAKEIQLFGDGEPLVYNKFWKVVEDIRKVNQNCNIGFICNGTLLNETNIKKCIEHKISYINLSLGGATKESHNKIRIGSDIDQILSNFKKLNDIKKEKKLTEPIISVLMIMMKSNYKEIPQMIKLCYEIGAEKLELQTLFITHPSMNEEVATDEEVLPYKKEAIELAKKLNISFNGYNRKNETERISKNKRNIVDNMGYCKYQQPWNEVYVLHDGKIVPDCHWWTSIRETHLNVCGTLNKHTNILDIWNGDTYKEIRERIQSGKILPQCRGCGLAGGVKKEYKCNETEHNDPSTEKNIVNQKPSIEIISDKVHCVHISQFYFLKHTPLMQNYINGYKEYQKHKEITKNNTYFKYLKSLNHFKYTYSDEEILSLANGRFQLFNSIKNGFDPKHYIRLFPLLYGHLTKRILTTDNIELYFDALDGYHRLMASICVNNKIVFVKQCKLEKNKFNLKHFSKNTEEYSWRWYQPIDFGPGTEKIHFLNKDDNLNGVKKYEFILKKHIQPAHNAIIDVGCNTGVITAKIAELAPRFAVGIEKPKMMSQIIYVKNILWKDYANLHFEPLDILKSINIFDRICVKYRPIDIILMSNFIYYMGDFVQDLIDICCNHAKKIILQGNTLKKENDKRVLRLKRDPSYRGEYSQIEGMTELLKSKCSIEIDAPPNYHKPVVVGIIK